MELLVEVKSVGVGKPITHAARLTRWTVGRNPFDLDR
jgi:hypothetical protein